MKHNQNIWLERKDENLFEGIVLELETTRYLIHVRGGSFRQCFNKHSGILKVSVGRFWLAATEPWL